MNFAFASFEDLEYLADSDHHVPARILVQKIERGGILVPRHAGQRVGMLRYGYFWDEIPFMNLLWIEEGLRNRGFGTQLVTF